MCVCQPNKQLFTSSLSSHPISRPSLPPSLLAPFLVPPSLPSHPISLSSLPPFSPYFSFPISSPSSPSLHLHPTSPFLPPPCLLSPLLPLYFLLPSLPTSPLSLPPPSSLSSSPHLLKIERFIWYLLEHSSTNHQSSMSPEELVYAKQ